MPSIAIQDDLSGFPAVCWDITDGMNTALKTPVESCEVTCRRYGILIATTLDICGRNHQLPIVFTYTRPLSKTMLRDSRIANVKMPQECVFVRMSSVRTGSEKKNFDS